MRKIKTNDIMKIVCSILKKEKNIRKLSIYELDSIVRILCCLPKFALFDDKVSVGYLDIMSLIDYNIIERIVDNDKVIIGVQNDTEIDDYLSKVDPAFVELCRTAINVKDMKDRLFQYTAGGGELELVSPNDIYTLSKINVQMETRENVIFTDGNIEFLDGFVNYESGISSCNVKITNATYNIFANLSDNKILRLRLRCFDYTSGHYLQEADNVFHGRDEHYEPVSSDEVKVYKLRIH